MKEGFEFIRKQLYINDFFLWYVSEAVQTQKNLISLSFAIVTIYCLPFFEPFVCKLNIEPQISKTYQNLFIPGSYHDNQHPLRQSDRLQRRARQAPHERVHGLVARPAAQDGRGEPQDAQLRDQQASRARVEDAERRAQAPVHRRGQAAAGAAHARAPGLQVPAEAQDQTSLGVGHFGAGLGWRQQTPRCTRQPTSLSPPEQYHDGPASPDGAGSRPESVWRCGRGRPAGLLEGHGCPGGRQGPGGGRRRFSATPPGHGGGGDRFWLAARNCCGFQGVFFIKFFK